MDHLTPDEAYERVTGQQKLAAVPDASVWVSANAGSGKTKVLIDRVARLLLSGAAPDCILCITYTKAAASEMQQRLFKRLGSWSVMADDELRRDLLDLQGGVEADYDQTALKTARALFAKALETPGGLRIETLHAFAGRVLRRFPLEAGVPPGFSELDDIEGERIWAAAARKAYLATFEAEDTREEFRTLIRNIGGLGLEGVTKLVREKAMALRVFLETQTITDARRRTLSEALHAPDANADELIAEAMGADLPRERIERAIDLYRDEGGKNNLASADKLQAVMSARDPAIAFEIYSGFFLTGKGEARKSLYTKKLEGTLLESIFHPDTGSETQRFKELLETLSAIRLRDRTNALLTVAAPVLAEHAYAKRIQAGLDFDDLIVETRKLLQTPGIAEWVLFKLDGGISHVLLDEAQDTSPEQWHIVNALVSEFFAGANAADRIRTLFVVGDEKQSIYSFQGADTAQFQSERQRFASRTDETDEGLAFHLPEIEMSFRTVPQVLEFVDHIFNAMTGPGRAPFSTETPAEADRIRHHAFRHNQPGQVEVWPLEKPVSAPTGVAWDAPLDMEREISAPALLSRQISRWISARLESDEGVWTEDRQPRGRKVDPGDILILVRSRGPLFRALIQALKAEGLPVAGADRVNLLDTLAVQDLLNLVRFVLCPEDDLTLAEILKGPFIGLLDDDRYLLPLAARRDGASLWSRLQASDMAEHQAATRFLSSVFERRHLPAYEFLESVLNTRDELSGQTGWQQIHSRFGLPARDPLEALLGIAGGMEDDEAASLQRFLDAVEHQNADIKRELSGPSGEIRVMTVHGAKGLEAPIVILPDTTGVAQDRLSGSVQFTDDGVPVWLDSSEIQCQTAREIREREKARQAAEANRLLYVALTRARDQLVICGVWRGRTKSGYQDGSWYDLCSQSLSGLEHRADFKMRDDVWMIGSLPKVEADEPTTIRQTSELILPDWMSRPVSQTARMIDQRAPSQLLPGDTPVLPPFGAQHQVRFQRGRLIHELLEILPDVPSSMRESRARRFLSRCLNADDADLAEDVLKTMFGVLNNPELAEVFGPGGRAEAPVVGSGPNLPKGLVINGRVDRMRITETEVLVIDYKTDRPPPKTPDAVAKPYLAQMGAYYDVLSSTYPQKTVKCALLWTHGPQIMLLSEQAMLEALANARAGV